MKDKYKSLIEIAIVILLFVLASYIVRGNIESISKYIGKGFVGVLIYLIIVVVSIVVAPVSMVPLMPLASNLWGWFISAILNIAGWTIGAMIAFYLARKYGIPLVSKFVSIKKINKLENFIPKKNVFWSIVFLRMSIPVDVLSYALGLFSKISLRSYFLATLIGVTPFAFVFSYAGVISFYYQISAILIALFISFIGVLVVLNRRNRTKTFK